MIDQWLMADDELSSKEIQNLLYRRPGNVRSVSLSTIQRALKVVGGGGAKGFLWGTLVLVMYLSDHKSN